MVLPFIEIYYLFFFIFHWHLIHFFYVHLHATMSLDVFLLSLSPLRVVNPSRLFSSFSILSLQSFPLISSIPFSFFHLSHPSPSYSPSVHFCVRFFLLFPQLHSLFNPRLFFPRHLSTLPPVHFLFNCVFLFFFQVNKRFHITQVDGRQAAKGKVFCFVFILYFGL